MTTTQCTAHSKQSGNRCKRTAIQGGTVCRYHGGAAPQVKEAARLRLLAEAYPAAAELARQMKDKGLPAGDRRHAAIAILDRAGLKPTDKVEVSGPGGGPIKTVDLSKYTDEELAMLERLAKKQAVQTVVEVTVSTKTGEPKPEASGEEQEW